MQDVIFGISLQNIFQERDSEKSVVGSFGSSYFCMWVIMIYVHFYVHKNDDNSETVTIIIEQGTSEVDWCTSKYFIAQSLWTYHAFAANIIFALIFSAQWAYNSSHLWFSHTSSLFAVKNVY